MFDSGALRARLTGVRDRIARAASRVGRDPASIRLVAVSKTFPSDHIRAVAEAGQLDFGENKVQEALRKIAETADLSLRWHLIGHLQSNKARKAGVFHTVHAVDDSDLLARLDEAAAAAGHVVNVLLQVNLAAEPSKHGTTPEGVAALLERARACSAIRMTGLMLLPPFTDNPEDSRPHFAALRALRETLVDNGAPADSLAELSMGMSHDFETAIEEGATIVRVGSAIFGARAPV